MDIINNIIDFCTNFIYTGGIFFGMFIVFLESFLPVLPLSVFVALNCNAFGFFIGVAALILISNAKEKVKDIKAMPVNYALFRTSKSYFYGFVIISIITAIIYIVLW